MKDAKEAQHPAFLDIHENLKKMFDKISGCSNNMDNFIIVEEKDVHLLENAFACSFDDFYPQTMIISAENLHYPAETFPLKISKLHEEILNSVLIPKEQTSEGQWNKDNDTAFETYLTQESEKRCTEIIADFKNKINNQYEPYIIDESETYIKRAFTNEKQKLKAIYALRQWHSKESYLIRSARMRIELFNKKWEKVEDDNNKFMRIMTKKTKDLEKHGVDIFNQAIKSGCEDYLNAVTLTKSEFLNDIDKQFIKITNRNDLAKVLNIFIKNNTEQNSIKNEVMGRIKTVIEDTCKNICDGLLSQNALTIEFNQALEWLKRLCNNIFIEQDHFNNSPG
ncbi:von willebrand factor type a domain protein [Gigaspora margarita]|uniref:von willebrand factor type a domain protein n=1 Tax=Gigaspora margarita TaxID=4874 RepID=A0A8H3XDH3_GIGMA|nr:von willebrand factor type a domain protein [Gigaspora margarita]